MRQSRAKAIRKANSEKVAKMGEQYEEHHAPGNYGFVKYRVQKNFHHRFRRKMIREERIQGMTSHQVIKPTLQELRNN